ncbi:MAG: NAD(P)-dependent oxidoreductase [Alphaproteobacteria bacterium]|nr:MAG: NAD(P)-dependent oxidoreductase [Alphaproteobacteria bacterium]
MPETILVTGASGKLGRLVLDELLNRPNVAPASIIAVSRDPARLADYAKIGVVTRRGDFDDPASLDRAFAGADRLLIISTDALDRPGRRLEQHKAAVAAASKAGVKRICYTSMPNPDKSVVTFAPDHLGTEQAIKASGIPYAILRCGWYMENLFMALPQALATGQWYTATGQGSLAYAARADLAAAIAGALAGKAAGSAIHTLTGPRLLTAEDVAAAVRAATGKPLQVVHVSDEQLAAGMKAAGLPDFVVAMLVSSDTNIRLGNFAIVTDDIEKLSGRKPISLETFLSGAEQALAA